MSEVAEVVYTEKEFAKILERIDELVDTIAESLIEMSQYFARMSHAQFTIVRERLSRRRVLTKDWIERIRLFGQGRIPEVLARLPKGPAAGLLKRASTNAPEAIKSLGDPKRVFNIVTSSGTAHKTVEEMNAKEFGQLIDPQKGIRSATEQKKALLSKMSKSKDIEQSTKSIERGAVDYENLYRDGDFVYVVSSASTIRVPIKALKSLQ